MVEPATSRKLEPVVRKTLDWLSAIPDWRTYDPYDIKGSDSVIGMLESQVRYAPLLLRVVHWAGLAAPEATRRFLGVQKALTPTGVAYLLSGVSRLRAVGFTDERLPLIAQSAYERIAALQNAEGGWGLPFPWYSAEGIVIPAGTTLSYTVYTVLAALADHYQVTKDPRVLRLISDALRTSLGDLNSLETRVGMAFSYSRYDHYEVINTNSLLAGLLARVRTWGLHLDDSALADSICEFVLSAQMQNGSWPYFHPGSGTAIATDNYHTAMTLQGLLQYAAYSEHVDSRLVEAIRRGAQFYLDHFIRSDGEPRLWVGRRYPVDIASCAEGIELLFTCSSGLERVGIALEKREALVSWTLSNMMADRGEWLFRRYGPVRIKLGSLRWGQAMMLRSLSGAYAKTLTG